MDNNTFSSEDKYYPDDEIIQLFYQSYFEKPISSRPRPKFIVSVSSHFEPDRRSCPDFIFTLEGNMVNVQKFLSPKYFFIVDIEYNSYYDGMAARARFVLNDNGREMINLFSL